MIVCERCNTENPNEARFCEACGVALWLAGRPEQSMNSSSGNGANSQNGSNGNSQANGANGSRSKTAETVAQRMPVGAEQQVAASAVGLGNPAHATLVIERGMSAGKKFLISSRDANIGRWDADGGVFPDVDLDSDDPEAKVSRRHARISLREGKYLIEDLGSTNGTFVNRGRRLAPGDRHPLKDGDEIIVGKTVLRFRVTK